MITFNANGYARATAAHPCPICKKTNWCSHHRDGGVVCMRIDSDRPNGSNGHWHYPNGEPAGGRWQELPAPPPASLRPSPHRVACDRAYRAVLAACPLSETDRDGLRSRGMSEAEISDGMYATLPPGRQPRIAAAAIAAAVAAVGEGARLRVPGIRGDLDAPQLTWERGGLLIPVLDAERHVIGLRLRVPGIRPGEKKMYLWLSSDQAEGIAKVDGKSVHVAYPEGWEVGAAPQRVVITEGEIKANMAARRLRCPVLSVPGYKSNGHVLDVLTALSAAAVDDVLPRVAIAYDQEENGDQAKNEEERRAAEKKRADVLSTRDALAGEIANAGYRVDLWDWDPRDAKGLDDLLLSGSLPFATAYLAGGVISTRDRGSDATVSVVMQAIRNPNLGGDVGGKVAALVAADLAAEIAKKPTADGYYRVASTRVADAREDQHAAVSPKTVSSYLKKWREHGVLDAEVRTVRKEVDGREVPVQETWVKPAGATLAEILAPFATAHIPREGKRGGHRPRRVDVLPATCPDCGDATAAVCPGCGAVHGLVSVSVASLPSSWDTSPGEDAPASPSSEFSPEEDVIEEGEEIYGDDHGEDAGGDPLAARRRAAVTDHAARRVRLQLHPVSSRDHGAGDLEVGDLAGGLMQAAPLPGVLTVDRWSA